MSKNKPVLAVDFDDIVADFNMEYHQWHNRVYGTKFTYSELITFDMCALYGIDEATLSKRMNHFIAEGHSAILPIEGAKEGLEILSAVCDLHVVTSRCESLHGVTTGWVSIATLEYFTTYHFTNGFNSIFPERKRNKLEVCREIGAIALIDDADQNAFHVAENGLQVFMLERPWNGKMPHGLINRLQNWEQITDEVLKIL